jgi:hypothetical protein
MSFIHKNGSSIKTANRFKNIEIIYQSELGFLGIYMTDIQKLGIHAQFLKQSCTK